MKRYSPYGADRAYKRKESEYVRNAARKGRLVLQELQPIMRRPCAYCGAPAAEEKPNGVDRVDNGGDYGPGNCVPACKLCNFMKGKLDVATFLNQVEKIAKNLLEARYAVSKVAGERPDAIYDD